MNQSDLFHKDHRPLEWVPYEVRYKFRCHDADCPGHDMGLQDWEAGQSWRNFRLRYPPERLPDMPRDRWWDQMVTPERAVHFFVGNIAARPRTFLPLRLFRLTVETLEKPQQRALF